MSDEPWYLWKRSAEQSCIMRETTDKRYRRSVWKALQLPPSAREMYYTTLPNYLMDKVRDRVKQIERKYKRR